ncbi:hypothetical protein NQ314_011753 [Rhamnusium bicolor]|uniref:Uncharacterized protein n=1 Tax=Rhamnusium bicolor TaxID=1586634 RepID=A0AAV8XFW4_9CUCU|nr:hypothetical protein NQ314_011753 [Rhamnusium bicolor]
MSRRGVLANEIKCFNESCDFVLHSKCLDIITKVISIEKKTFRCKSCYEVFKNSLTAEKKYWCIRFKK